jgi:hypothetical protein
LRTSSNTLSVRKKITNEISLLISHKGMHFPSCNFYLKKCLGELAQFKTKLQFEKVYQPVRTNP